MRDIKVSKKSSREQKESSNNVDGIELSQQKEEYQSKGRFSQGVNFVGKTLKQICELAGDGTEAFCNVFINKRAAKSSKNFMYRIGNFLAVFFQKIGQLVQFIYDKISNKLIGENHKKQNIEPKTKKTKTKKLETPETELSKSSKAKPKQRNPEEFKKPKLNAKEKSNSHKSRVQKEQQKSKDINLEP